MERQGEAGDAILGCSTKQHMRDMGQRGYGGTAPTGQHQNWEQNWDQGQTKPGRAITPIDLHVNWPQRAKLG